MNHCTLFCNTLQKFLFFFFFYGWCFNFKFDFKFYFFGDRKEWKPGFKECAMLRRQLYIPQSTQRYVNVLSNESVIKGLSFLFSKVSLIEKKKEKWILKKPLEVKVFFIILNILKLLLFMFVIYQIFTCTNGQC